jgi:hypothetical protein
VTLNTGGPAPDGTSVSFRTTYGSITPFAQTTEGVAEADFTAPSTAGTCTITATAGGKSGTTNVTVTAPVTPPVALAINPPSASSIVGICATFTFTITGGDPPYTTSSSNINRAFNDDGTGVGGNADNCIRDGSELGVWTGSSITVTVPDTATAGTVDLNVSDSAGGTVKATITIQP